MTIEDKEDIALEIRKIFRKNAYGTKFEIYLKEVQSKVDTSKKYIEDAFEIMVEGLEK